MIARRTSASRSPVAIAAARSIMAVAIGLSRATCRLRSIAGRRVGVVVEHGGLGPQGGVPRPPRSAARGPAQLGGRRCRPRVAVRRWPGRRDGARAGCRTPEANRASDPASCSGIDAEVDGQADPGRAAVVVAAHAVHHRDGVRRTGQVRRDRSSRPLPAGAEALSGSDHVVEVTGQRVDHQAPGQGQVILVAVERQAGRAPRRGRRHRPGRRRPGRPRPP